MYLFLESARFESLYVSLAEVIFRMVRGGRGVTLNIFIYDFIFSDNLGLHTSPAFNEMRCTFQAITSVELSG